MPSPACRTFCRTHGVLARSLDLARLVVGHLDLVERAVGVLARPLHAEALHHVLLLVHRARAPPDEKIVGFRFRRRKTRISQPKIG